MCARARERRLSGGHAPPTLSLAAPAAPRAGRLAAAAAARLQVGGDARVLLATHLFGWVCCYFLLGGCLCGVFGANNTDAHTYM